MINLWGCNLGFSSPFNCHFFSPFFPKTCDTKLICINWYQSHDLYDFYETMFFQNAICCGIYVAPVESMEERNEERKAKKVRVEQCKGLKSLFNHPSWHHCCHQQTTLLPAKHHKKKKRAETLCFLAIPWWTSNLLCKSPIFATLASKICCCRTFSFGSYQSHLMTCMVLLIRQ